MDADGEKKKQESAFRVRQVWSKTYLTPDLTRASRQVVLRTNLTHSNFRFAFIDLSAFP